jgi:hypothetical protein
MGAFVSIIRTVAFIAAGVVLAGSAAAHRAPQSRAHPGSAPGLGAVLTTSDGGQIYGFDIDQSGNDGVLASAQTIDGNGDVKASMQTFDANTGKITKTFAAYTGHKNEYGMDGIFAGDVALVTHYITPKGTIYAKRKYEVMNPVSGGAFTGAWTPPLKDMGVLEAPSNQSTSTTVLFGIELKKQDNPVLIVSDIAANAFPKVIKLDPDLFGLADSPNLGYYEAGNEAVLALSPDAGAVHGKPPLNVLVDLSTGESTTFNGYNNGFYHAGSVDGFAVDQNTGVGATDTELNAQVEFYDFISKSGIAAVQLPCTGATDQSNSGSGIAVDPVHKLFLVTDYFYCDGSKGSAIVVYDEKGKYLESITGFHFAIGEPPPVLNPKKRMGWAFGGPGGFDQLQQFFY